MMTLTMTWPLPVLTACMRAVWTMRRSSLRTNMTSPESMAGMFMTTSSSPAPCRTASSTAATLARVLSAPCGNEMTEQTLTSEPASSCEANGTQCGSTQTVAKWY